MKSKDTYTYFAFPVFDNIAWLDANKGINEIIDWLAINTDELRWHWERGDRYARGIFIYDDAVAMAFKLRFGYESHTVIRP